MLDDCPIARSLAEIVDSGKPFIWLPNQLPYFVNSWKDISIRCKGKALVADRLDDGVPVFKEIIQLHTNALAFPASSSSAAKPDEAVGSEQNPPHAPPRGDAPIAAPDAAVESDEEYVGKEEELLRESMSLKRVDVQGCINIAPSALVQIHSMIAACFHLLMHLAKG